MHRMKRYIPEITSFLSLALAAPLLGQTSTALTGVVSDTTGAVVVKATVTLHNEQTGQDLTTVTTHSGNFTFTNIRPGTYDVSTSAPGFDTAVEAGVALHLDAVASVKLVLKPGRASETVTVKADEIQLDVTHPSRGETFTQDEMEQSPFDSGNPLLLANSEPGVTFTGAYNAGAPFVRPFDYSSINQFSVNGGAADSNDFQLDGSPNNTITFGVRNIGIVPPVASIQEMKVIINPYDAQYGHTGGGIFDIVTKYGGNKFHGQVYENARRTWLDANTHFNDANGVSKESDTRDQFGFEIDGPLVLPHFYNGHDKTFFELQLERYNEKQPASGVDSVPELSPGSTTQTAWQTGDFSGAYYFDGTAGNQPLLLYNPLSITAPGQASRTPFTNNQIPVSLMDPTARAVLSYLPLPNRKTPYGLQWGENNYVWSETVKIPFESVIGRLDHNFSEKDRTYIRYAWDKNWQNGADTNGIPGAAATGVFPLIFQSAIYTADWQHVFSPNSLFDFHTSFARFVYPQNEGPTPFNLANIGLGQLTPQVTESVFPQFFIGGVTSFGNWASNGGNKLTISNTLSAMPMWTLVGGSHNMKLGLDYRLLRSSSYIAGASSGTFSSGCFWTQQLNYNSCPINQGNGLASFALGIMDSGSISIATRQYFTYPYYAPFFQDDWKIRKNLTINLGVRWDFQGPPSESANKVVGAFDPNVPNPAGVSGLPAGVTLRGGMTFPGVNGAPTTLFNRDKLLIQPRVGVNYQVDKNTVFRGGLGTTYVQFPGQGYNQGYTAQTNYVSSTTFGQTANGDRLSNPFPVIAQPTGNSEGIQTSLGNYFNVVNRGFRIPGVLNYSLGMEHTVGSHASIDLSYVGNHAFHQDTATNINEVSEAYQSGCNLEMGAAVATYLSCLNYSTGNPQWVANPFLNNPNFSTAATGNLNGYYTNAYLPRSIYTRPYPQFGDITETEHNDGYSTYNSLQVVYTHHWSDALVLHSNFVWAKQMDGGGWSDQIYGIRQHFLDRGVTPLRFATNADWHLPIGRGRTFLRHTNRVVDAAIGNWVVGAIYYYQAGLPAALARGGGNLEILHPGRYSNHRTINLAGDQVIRESGSCVGWYDPYPQDNPASSPSHNNASYTLGDVEGQDYSNCAATATGHVYDYIARPSYAEVANVSDAGIRLPRGQNLDVSISKSFPLWESLKLQTRLEAYNAPNHPSWAGLDTWTDIFDPNFGTTNMHYDVQSNIPRNVQLSAKLIW